MSDRPLSSLILVPCTHGGPVQVVPEVARESHFFSSCDSSTCCHCGLLRVNHGGQDCDQLFCEGEDGNVICVLCETPMRKHRYGGSL